MGPGEAESQEQVVPKNLKFPENIKRLATYLHWLFSLQVPVLESLGNSKIAAKTLCSNPFDGAKTLSAPLTGH